MQAACVRALVSAEPFQQGTNLDRWVFTILTFIRKNQLRSNAVQQGCPSSYKLEHVAA